MNRGLVRLIYWPQMIDVSEVCAFKGCFFTSHLWALGVLQPSFVSEVTAPGRSALDSVEVAYGRQVSRHQDDCFHAQKNIKSGHKASSLQVRFLAKQFYFLS